MLLALEILVLTSEVKDAEGFKTTFFFRGTTGRVIAGSTKQGANG